MTRLLPLNVQIWIIRRTYSRSPAALATIGVGVTLVLALIVVIILLLTGGATYVSTNAALIGALIALGGVFTTQLVNTGLEAQRAREAALQKYLEQVGKLLIEHPENASLGTVGRAQTLAVLEGLDPDRKRILLQFLYESDLIKADAPVITLRGANLRGAYLKGAFLEGADLERAERLTQEQIDEAFGDEDTKLPDHLQRPAHWGKRDRPRAPKQKGYQGAPPRTTNINAWR